MKEDADKYFYMRDHLGSVREVMKNNSSTVEARYDYDPWGRQTQTAGTRVFDIGYAGYMVFAPTGTNIKLNLTWYRAYSPELGRWLSRDPIGEEGGLNLYRYVKNSPIDYDDYLGLICGTPGVMDKVVPDYRFREACRIHDDCYTNHRYGHGAMGQWRCDIDLCRNAKEAYKQCSNPFKKKPFKYMLGVLIKGGKRVFCEAAAITYCGTVTGGGGDAFNNGAIWLPYPTPAPHGPDFPYDQPIDECPNSPNC